MKNVAKTIERIDQAIAGLSAEDYVKFATNDPSLYYFKGKGGKNTALIVSVSKFSSMEIKKLYEKKIFEAYGDDVNLFETNYTTVLVIFNVEWLDREKLRSLITNMKKFN